MEKEKESEEKKNSRVGKRHQIVAPNDKLRPWLRERNSSSRVQGIKLQFVICNSECRLIYYPVAFPLVLSYTPAVSRPPNHKCGRVRN